MRISDVTSPPVQSPSIKLFLAIPTLGTCSIEFATSLAKTVCHLVENNVSVSIKRLGLSCNVDMARNRLVAEFLDSDCTHIGFIDDDMGWDHDVVLKMLHKNKDFIAGAGPLKKDEEEYATKTFSDGHGYPIVVDGLIKSEMVGGAFCFIKREVFQRISATLTYLGCRAIAPRGQRYYENEYTFETWKTEDYVFCDRWRQVGGEIWVYPNINFTHTGTKVYKGNYHKFLLPKADENIKDETKIKLCLDYVKRISNLLEEK